jgi:glutathione S-transferase
MRGQVKQFLGETVQEACQPRDLPTSRSDRAKLAETRRRSQFDRMNDVTLYFSPASRCFTPCWLLEEIGVPYRLKTVNLRKSAQKSAEYLRINPMGKVPALTDGDVTVTENPAICMYLADRYSYGALAPKIGDAARGSWLRWMVFSTAVLEPSIYLDEPADDAEASGCGWGYRRTVLATLDDALAEGPWLLGERFSAADVMLGSLLSIALYSRRIANPPASLIEYDTRLAARPAYKRAAETTWPPHLFGGEGKTP